MEHCLSVDFELEGAGKLCDLDCKHTQLAPIPFGEMGIASIILICNHRKKAVQCQIRCKDFEARS